MFYLRYLGAEIVRRLGKTVIMVLGLGTASAIIIAIISFSQSLSGAQQKILNPLQNVGTDLMVTRTIDANNLAAADKASRDEYASQNSATLDFSKLGTPGSKFSDDVFLAGNLLTFDQTVTQKADRSVVSDMATGLILNIAHREGTIPKVSATITVGGEKIKIDQNIAPMTPTEMAVVEAARNKAMQDIEARGIDPKSNEAAKIIQDAEHAATPSRFKSFQAEITTERKTITQDVGNIQTDVTTQNYTIAGVDTTKRAIGLLLPGQVKSGTYFTGDGQIILSQRFAAKNNKKLGDEITIKQTKFKVVGIAEPALYTNVADYYVPLNVLQQLAGRQGRANILLVKTPSAGAVATAEQKLKNLFPGATVASSKDTAEKVSGSLLQAANLTNQFVGVMSVIVIAAACAIAALLTVSSINKRTREIGTLKAIGWSNLQVIRQMSLENATIGLLGAVVGIGAGLLMVYGLNNYDISFDATIDSLNASIRSDQTGDTPSDIATSQKPASVSQRVELQIDPTLPVILLGAGVSLLGSLVAGVLAAVKVTRLKPQEALRSLE